MVARRPVGVRLDDLRPGLAVLGRLIDGVGAQQCIDEPHERASGRDERSLVGMFGEPRIFGIIIDTVLRTLMATSMR